MTKNDLKLLVETDEKLGWWCGVLMGEICEIVQAQKSDRGDVKHYYDMITWKVTELDQLIIQRALEKAKEQGVKTVE